MTPLTPKELQQRAQQIKVVIFDVDGVMTDGKLYLNKHGEETKTMNIKDGLGLKRLQGADIIPAVISGRPSPAVAQRMHQLGVQHVYLDSHNKTNDFEALLAELGLTPKQAAFMGDDLPDLPVMKRVGLALAVADAVPEIINIAHWVSPAVGGDGAVRQACELIIQAQNAI